MACRTAALLLLTSLACAGQTSVAPTAIRDAETYLRWVAFEAPGGEYVLLRWPKRRMPLKVHLLPPPSGLFDDPKAVHTAVREGVLDWTDVAAPGIPSFDFVDNPGEADIPIVWAREPTADWYIAFLAFDVNLFQRRFGVDHLLVTGRWGNGRIATPKEIYSVVLHEMGHALGFAAHSPDPGDIMFSWPSEGLSDRDRNTLRALYHRPIGSREVGGRRVR